VQLRQDDDEIVQLEALSQLNELLSISNEESLSVFPVEQLVPVLVCFLDSLHGHGAVSSPCTMPIIHVTRKGMI
jgi:hypothetical protein